MDKNDDLETNESPTADLEAAWDQLESSEDESSNEASDEGNTEEQDAEASLGADDGEAASTDASDDTSRSDISEQEEASPSSDEQASGESDSHPSVDENPPASWRPSVRESWKDLPANVKAEIQRRENDFAVGIQRSSEAAQYAHRLSKTVEPLRPFFNANGLSDEQGMQSVMQTAGMLMGGAPLQKAQAVANLISQYGVDIEALDGMLAGTPTGHTEQAGAVTPAIQQAIAQAVAPYRQNAEQMQRMQQQATQRQQQQSQQTLQQFAQDPSHEFYMDVRGQMAMLLDNAANTGQSMNLQQAYDTACRMNPEIFELMQRRAQADNPANKVAAAVSVVGDPGGDTSGPAPANLRDGIMAAWNAAEVR